jgi:3-phosphoshikimate 1-carboxyvinyltransferase
VKQQFNLIIFFGMRYIVSRTNKDLKGEIHVPASKSISNRLLIIQALCSPPFKIENLSDSEDTKVLARALQESYSVADIGHAGTSMRFLTAFFASREGYVKTLTGSQRMKERPIGNLVDALLKLGANISYPESEGFPPLLIIGQQLAGGKVSIDSSVSSQFISALLLSAPTFQDKLELQLENKVISSSYIDLTIKIMEYMGVHVEKQQNCLIVTPQKYQPKDITVEGDWSGVSYWYQLAALADSADIFIHSLQENSLQGDSHCADIFKSFGIQTEYEAKGIRIYKNGKLPSKYEFDFIENPDLVQTVAVTCVMLGIPFVFCGTQSLKIKETDRIVALQTELQKFGAELEYNDSGILSWNGVIHKTDSSEICIQTYHDHRMALAFAPIALCQDNIIIADPSVVIKSYPNYWNDMKTMGFAIEEY